MASSAALPATISLVGMPGAGKSTVGILLAKLCGLRFVDTDIDIQTRAGATLQEILDRHGYLHLRELEEQVLLEVDLDHAVVATGGSVVYSAASMRRLAGAGPVVYLQAGLAVLSGRVAAAPLRGIASDATQDFAAIFDERTPLYERFANLTVAADRGTADEVAARILRGLRQEQA
jgi:shikimate kinase